MDSGPHCETLNFGKRSSAQAQVKFLLPTFRRRQAGSGPIEVKNVAPEYPIVWPFGEQSKSPDGPRRVHETRVDALYHVQTRGASTGTLVLVEYKMHMELQSRCVWARGASGASPPVEVRERRTLGDVEAARSMLDTVATRQTYQNRQAETNAWLVYVNTGVLPTHCIVVHSTRRQESCESRRPSVHGVTAGGILGRSRFNDEVPVPCCVVCVRRLDMRQEFMRCA